jgi:hypothetical protein
MTIKFTEATLRDPWESEKIFVSYEPQFECTGWCCGHVFVGEEPYALSPHFHMVVRGEQPEAATRHYPIFFDS